MGGYISTGDLQQRSRSYVLQHMCQGWQPQQLQYWMPRLSALVPPDTSGQQGSSGSQEDSSNAATGPEAERGSPWRQAPKAGKPLLDSILVHSWRRAYQCVSCYIHPCIPEDDSSSRFCGSSLIYHMCRRLCKQLSLTLLLCRYPELCLADEIKGVPLFDGYRNCETAWQMVDSCAYVNKRQLQEIIENW